MRRLSFAAVALVALAGLATALVACGGDNEEETPAKSPTAAAQEKVTPQVGEAQVAVDVEQDDFYFKPEELKLTLGQTLEVTLENEGGAAHTFTIDELGIDQVVQPGEEAVVTVTPEEAGTLAFYCRFHRGQGMEGELTVTAGGASAAPSGPAPAGGGAGTGSSTGSPRY